MNQPSLKTKCFISMEAVKWLQEKLDGEPSRKDIVKTMQVRGRITVSTD